MLLESRANFLVLHDDCDTQRRRVVLADTLEHAVANWTSNSRLSPIWPIKGYDTRRESFAGRQQLLFLGPVQPARLDEEIKGLADAKQFGLWLTAGCFNIAIRLDKSREGAALGRRVVAWAKTHAIAHEVWTLTDGAITKSQHHVLRGGNPQPAIDRLAASIAKNDAPALRSTFQENLIVTATSLARAAAVYPPIFTNLEAIAEAACGTVQSYEKGELSLLEMQSRLLSMNAALSRFSSQAFSGTPPIEGTECHFWIHSLLGTGSANIALANLVASIQKVLGEARLPERLIALENKTASVPNKEALVSDAALLNFDIMRETQSDSITTESIIPLVTYFSGRDGFSSQLQTLSAPLTTLAECNSLRSNLLTVTHEISHIFVQSALAVLSPSLGEQREMDHARKIAQPQFSAANQLDAARQLVVEAVITMETVVRELPDDKVGAELPRLFEQWRHEVQEILVHTFDFLYFHQGDPEYYVTSIWHSWCSIPGIGDRVPEYLMRTMCAVSATLLTTSTKVLFEAVVESTKSLLSTILPRIEHANNYVEQALALMESYKPGSDLAQSVERAFFARLYLVRLVRIFLYSERLAAQLFADPHIRPSSADPDKKRLQYNTSPLGNALTFLKGQLKDNPTDAESIWVLHCLAFDLASLSRPAL